MARIGNIFVCYGGPWFAEKLLLRSLYYVAFPAAVEVFGFLGGWIVMSVGLLVLSVSFMRVYDQFKLNIFDVSALKIKIKNCLQKFFGLGHDRTENGLKRWVFVILAWQFFPPVCVLSLRTNGTVGPTNREIRYLAYVSFLSGLYWAGIGKLILEIPMSILRWIIVGLLLLLVIQTIVWYVAKNRRQK